MYILSGQTFDRENKRGGAVITIKGSGLLLATSFEILVTF